MKSVEEKVSLKKRYRNERQKNLVRGNPLTVLIVSMFLLSAADFITLVGRGGHCLYVGKFEKKGGKKSNFDRKLVSRTLGELVFI